MKPLYACLLAPDFAVAVARLGEPAAACVAVEGEGPARTVHTANEAARHGGARAGMALAEAQARFALARPGERLRAVPRDEPAERRMRRRLLETASAVSPRVEELGDGLLLADLAGLPDPHASAREWVRAVEALGLPARVAVSQRRFVALCAARARAGVTHIFPEQEEGFLRVLPVSALPLEAGEAETLARWDVRTLGELARLPEDALTARLGLRGARLARLARGDDDSLFQAAQPERGFERRVECEWGVESLESLAFLLAAPVEGLSEELERAGMAAEALTAEFDLDDGSRCARTAPLAQPLTGARALLTVLRLRLAAQPPGAAVVGLTLRAAAVPRRRTQGSLFEPAAPSPEALAVTLARLGALVGPERVGAPEPADTHRPREFRQREFAPPRQPARGTPDPKANPGAAALALRCFRPPLEAEVVERGGRPVRLASAAAGGPILRAAGPWRTSGEWWSDGRWSWDEWDVELRQGLYRLCQARAERLWRLAGVYD